MPEASLVLFEGTYASGRPVGQEVPGGRASAPAFRAPGFLYPCPGLHPTVQTRVHVGIGQGARLSYRCSALDFACTDGIGGLHWASRDREPGITDTLHRWSRVYSGCFASITFQSFSGRKLDYRPLALSRQQACSPQSVL